MDSNFNFNEHVTNTCKSVNIQLQALKHIRKFLDQNAANTVASAIIGSRLDYCNSVFTGITNYNINRLQRVQNRAAKIVLNDYTCKNVQNRILNDLHWLPIPQRIEYKILLLTYKTLLHGQPNYLFNILHSYNPARSLRSSTQFLLEVPQTKTALQDRAVAPKLFNELPIDLRKFSFQHHFNDSKLNSITTVFKNNLKTFLYKKAMPN